MRIATRPSIAALWLLIDVTSPVAQFLASQIHEFDLVSRRILMSKRERVFGNSQDTLGDHIQRCSL